MVPLDIRFDGAANILGSHIVRMPKLSQGAPYAFGFKIRYEDNTYRNFEPVETPLYARWRIKLRPSDLSDLMVLTKANGNFIVSTDLFTNDTLTFVVKATDWTDITIPRSANHMDMDVPFSFVVEFMTAGGVVTERFAQGSGLISVSLSP